MILSRSCSHKKCCLCHGIVHSKKHKYKAGAPSIHPLIQEYLESYQLNFEIGENHLLCPTCHSKFRSGRKLPQRIKCKRLSFCNLCDDPLTIPSQQQFDNHPGEAIQGSSNAVEPNTVNDPAYSEDSESGWSGTTIDSQNSDEDFIWDIEEPSQFSSSNLDYGHSNDESEDVFSLSYSTNCNETDILENASENKVLMESNGMSTVESHDTSVFIKVPTIKSTSQARCFICSSGESTGKRLMVPQKAAAELFLVRRILLPRSKVRCCGSHLLPNGYFKEDVLEQMEATKIGVKIESKELSKFLLDVASVSEQRLNFLDFGPNSRASSYNYELLTGMSSDHFRELFSKISVDLRDSCNRSPENALAIFLIKLRLNLSQNVIALLFGIKNNQPQATVSSIFNRVASLLNEKFVPKYLGYGHLTREECIQNHSSSLASKLCGAAEGTIIVIMDGTYLYIQKPSDHVDQKKTFSLHKHRNLLKPMMVILPDGYIIEADGLYYADYKNNDARILLKMLNKKENGIMSFLQSGDHAFLDRGFRDSIDACTKENLITLMPQLLKRKQKSFTTLEGNESRRVTFLRWVVEAVNGRIKNKFPFFASTIPVTYAPKLNVLFRICCAICNAFCPPIRQQNEGDVAKADRILELISTENELQKLIETNKLATKRTCWSPELATTVRDFPVLSIDDLRFITMGTFQLEMARYYTRRHIKGNNYGGYEIFLHKTIANLLYSRFASRFSGRPHQVFVQYDPSGAGTSAILQWYCSCQAGARTVGCCSHIASILFFMGHAKHQAKDIVGSSTMEGHILDAALLDEDSSSGVAIDENELDFEFEFPEEYDDDDDSMSSNDNTEEEMEVESSFEIDSDEMNKEN